MSFESLSVTHANGVARIELQRPESMNALSLASGAELRDAVVRAGEDPGVRALLITGAGRGFSAGADLKDPDPRITPEGNLDLAYSLREVFNPTIVALREMPKLAVAAVNGPAVGVGCSIALACDFVVASRSAYFLMAFVNIGLVFDGGASVLLPAKIGITRATELAMLGDRLPAEQALEWGMINQVVEDADLPAVATALVDRLARGAPLAQAAMKRMLNRREYAGLAEALELEAQLQAGQAEAPEFLEGVSAFLQKRPPDFTSL